ncbi:MAG: DUF2442 domain-containing protein, partial [Spirochaetota bacterium]
KAVTVTADTKYIIITFADGRILSVPVSHFKEFDNISKKEIAQCRIFHRGEGIAWDKLNVRMLLGLPQAKAGEL